jgi:pyruvate carboxylase subunit A
MKKILVANRGEIAVRIIKTIRKMGLESVAIFSEADRNAPHVKIADYAFYIGESPSSESYLKGEKIIDLAKKWNVDAIHPGYGFLSENAAFAKAVEEAGIIFIGPSSFSISIMGNKLAAKEAVEKFRIPMVPGLNKPVESLDEARNIALEIGFPILIKAAAGGGGKGMRIVFEQGQLDDGLVRAQSEAMASFGDSSVFIEKYIHSPKHIEFQVLADNFGETIHLFERECSIQRRHQKVVEEAPSNCLTPEVREKMGIAAVNVAKSCNYKGAGTVEFLVDEDLNFYFLEMNTRLQVEHPVTEMITGIDLVEEQIRIARGEHIRYKQEMLKINGHAIELRVYAENPFENFLPNTGKLNTYQKPELAGIRIDDGYDQGMEIPIFYDSMISKLISWGENKNIAIQRMSKAIEAYRIEGVETTLPFGQFVLSHPSFISGNFDTHFIDQYFDEAAKVELRENLFEEAAKAAIFFYRKSKDKIKLPARSNFNKI